MQVLRLGRFIFNNNTKQELIDSDLVLLNGEIALEQDTQLMKVGDGKTLYKDLPYLNRGEKGEKGEKGDIGETGTGLSIKGSFATTDELPQMGEAGDGYMVVGDLYLWSDTEWVNVGQIKGEKGDKGDKGEEGEKPVLTVSDGGTWVVDGVDTGALARGPKGDRGDIGPRGFTGEKGDPFLYSDFTEEQLTALVGPQGDPGENATTTAVATTTTNGLMSSADKVKLNGVETGAQKNSVTSVQGRTGAVTISKSDVGLGSVNNVAITAAQVTKINELNYTRAMTEAAYEALSEEKKDRLDVWYGIYEE